MIDTPCAHPGCEDEGIRACSSCAYVHCPEHLQGRREHGGHTWELCPRCERNWEAVKRQYDDYAAYLAGWRGRKRGGR